MRSLYSHYRAPHLWSRGKSSTDPIAVSDCADQLRKYGYEDHASELDKRVDELRTTAPAVAIAPEVAPASPALKARRTAKARKKAPKEGS